jgi:RNA polymerase sigma-70 factor (ECF subfamily)
VTPKQQQSKLEEFLLLRIRAFQDREAFRVLIQEHAGSMLRFLHFKLPRHEDAEDVYSNVCLELWEYLSRTEVKSFVGVMFTVARAQIANFYHRRARSESRNISIQLGEGLEIQIPSRESVGQMQDKLDVNFMEEKMRLLSDDDRELIIMRYLEGYRVKDIAKKLHKSENVVSVTLHRALQKLRDLYEAE